MREALSTFGIAFVALPCLVLASPLCAAAPHLRRGSLVRKRFQWVVESKTEVPGILADDGGREDL